MILQARDQYTSQRMGVLALLATSVTCDGKRAAVGNNLGKWARVCLNEKQPVRRIWLKGHHLPSFDLREEGRRQKEQKVSSLS